MTKNEIITKIDDCTVYTVTFHLHFRTRPASPDNANERYTAIAARHYGFDVDIPDPIYSNGILDSEKEAREIITKALHKIWEHSTFIPENNFLQTPDFVFPFVRTRKLEIDIDRGIPELRQLIASADYRWGKSIKTLEGILDILPEQELLTLRNAKRFGVSLKKAEQIIISSETMHESLETLHTNSKMNTLYLYTQKCA